MVKVEVSTYEGVIAIGFIPNETESESGETQTGRMGETEQRQTNNSLWSPVRVYEQTGNGTD